MGRRAHLEHSAARWLENVCHVLAGTRTVAVTAGRLLALVVVKSAPCLCMIILQGSEAEIDGMRPTEYMHFDDSYPNSERVHQVLNRMALPPEDAPDLVLMYFSDIDHAGHAFGPNSEEVNDAIISLDGVIGLLAG